MDKNMGRNEVLLKLKALFEDEPKEEQKYTVESRHMDNSTYRALVSTEKEAPIKTHPDYEAFIGLLKYQKSSDCNKVINILTNKAYKLFVEYTEAQRKEFLRDMSDHAIKLRGSNLRTRPLVEYTLVDWALGL